MKNRFMLLLATVALVTLLAGCSQDPYRVAAQLGDDLGMSINESAQQVDALRLQGLVTMDTEKSVLTWLRSLNALNGTYLSCVDTAHLAGNNVQGFIACADSLLADATKPETLAALNVSNPASQQRVNTIVSSVRVTIDGAKTALLKIKGGN